jgi:hypothetical protein
MPSWGLGLCVWTGLLYSELERCPTENSTAMWVTRSQIALYSYSFCCP